MRASNQITGKSTAKTKSQFSNAMSFDTMPAAARPQKMTPQRVSIPRFNGPSYFPTRITQAQKMTPPIVSVHLPVMMPRSDGTFFNPRPTKIPMTSQTCYFGSPKTETTCTYSDSSYNIYQRPALYRDTQQHNPQSLNLSIPISTEESLKQPIRNLRSIQKVDF